MAQIRIQGPANGSNLGTVSVTAGNGASSVEVTSFGVAPPLVLPLIAGPQADGETATLDTSLLNNVTSIQWRVQGGANLGTASPTATTQDLTDLGGDYVEAVTVSDEGTLTSPPMLVHTPMMIASHNRDDAAVVALASHNKMNRVAAQSGDWSNPLTWSGGSVPQGNDSVLIPAGVAVTYDVDAPSTLIRRLRVDGTFRLATGQNTHLYVRDFIGDRLSTIALGNSVSDRIATNNQATITIEGQSSLDLVEDPRLFSRGIITLGTLNTFGADKLNHSLAAFGEPAGSTSIILEKTPRGWGVGDQIVIGGTAIARNENIGAGIPNVAEDEIVTITGISNNTVSFTPALVNDHNNQNTRAPDNNTVRPMVQLRAQSRNLIVKSETLTPATQRGHVMVMHMHSRQDVWDIGLIGLGRTEKNKRIGEIDDADGTFKTWEFNENGNVWEIVNIPLTADANMRGRYSYHSHTVGYGHDEAGRPVPQLVNVTVEDTPGWAVAHHDCEMDIRASSAFRFYGCGFIGEQGGELGVWDDLSAMQATALNINQGGLNNLPKGQQSQYYGLGGDFFNDGYGFGYRGRSLKTTRCFATSCTWGHVFWHRFLSDGDVNSLFDVTNPPRDRMDLGELGLFNNSNVFEPDTWSVSSYPIIHFADCGAIGCFNGTYVTKGDPRQQHDYNVIWKGFKAWGNLDRGMMIEYVATYILVDIEVVDGPYGGNGIDLGANTYQIAIVRPRTEGCQFNGIRVSGSTLYPDGSASPDDWDAAANPRFFIIGQDSVNDGNEYLYTNAATKTFEQIAYINDDLDATYIDYDLNPTETWPDVIGTWNGTNANSSLTSFPDNTNLKVGNHPVGLPIAPKTYGDSLFPLSASPIKINNFVDAFGYYQSGAIDVLIQRDIISDVLTGRPAKFTSFWQADNPVDFGTDNGPVTMGAAVSASDILLTVAPGGSVTFDALGGVTGGTGSFEIDPGDYTAPDYGKFDINYGTGQVTFTARPGVEDQSDFGYLFIRSVRETGATDTETRTYGTRQIRILITSDATLAAPVHNTHFTFAQVGAGPEFTVNLAGRPQSGGRRILVAQYSTDAGVTWRRLCNGWPRADITVDLESDGTALSAGVVDVRLRYFTDHEYGNSPETVDVAARALQPVTLIFGQSNAGFLGNNDSMVNEITALGGSTVELLSAVGGASATGIDGAWNIVDGDASAGTAYTALLSDVSSYLAANPNSFIASAVWVHGEADAASAPTRADYEVNVTAIFDGIRAEVGYDFPISVTGISDLQGQWTDFATDTMNGYMQDLAANVTNVYFVDLEAIIAANGFVKEDVLNDALHWNGMFLDLMATEIMAEPAIRARYGIV